MLVGAVIAHSRKKTETAFPGDLDPTGEAIGVVGRDYRNPQPPSTTVSTLASAGKHGPTQIRLAQSWSTQVVVLPFAYGTVWRVIVAQGLVHPHEIVSPGAGLAIGAVSVDNVSVNWRWQRRARGGSSTPRTHRESVITFRARPAQRPPLV